MSQTPFGMPRPERPAARTDTPATFADATRVFWRHRSPRLLLGVLAAAAGLKVGVGGWSRWDLLIPALILAGWPVLEWCIHVFVLHFRPRTVAGIRIDPPTPRSHRRHHANPWDLAETFIPPWVHPYALPLTFFGWWLALPAPQAATAVCAFFALTLHYEWCHYLAHVRYTPDIPYYQRICRSHLNHHFRHEGRWYGVSMLGGDWLFRTGPDPKDVTPSPNCRALPGGV